MASAFLLGNTVIGDDDGDNATRRRPPVPAEAATAAEEADSAYILVFRCTPVQMQCKQRGENMLNLNKTCPAFYFWCENICEWWDSPRGKFGVRV